MQVTVRHVFFAPPGGDRYCRIYCTVVSSTSGSFSPDYNFDLVDPNEARKFYVGQTIQITPDPNHPPCGCIPVLP